MISPFATRAGPPPTDEQIHGIPMIPDEHQVLITSGKPQKAPPESQRQTFQKAATTTTGQCRVSLR